MDLRKLKTLIDLVSESGISELEVTEGEGKVRIVKNAPPVYVQPSASYAAPQFAPPAPAAAG
ncbi:acetyl-CoA carboxylase biotin carboxyl carrier protein, partial [Paraburkholderia sp. Cy-641]|nr:acetyl-CoA carboxylase biotin carboxyl carrier protein [Paraburkholderia sp. Cy-641]